jgi:hypothetical protein
MKKNNLKKNYFILILCLNEWINSEKKKNINRTQCFIRLRFFLCYQGKRNVRLVPITIASIKLMCSRLVQKTSIWSCRLLLVFILTCQNSLIIIRITNSFFSFFFSSSKRKKTQIDTKTEKKKMCRITFGSNLSGVEYLRQKIFSRS